MQIQQKEEGQHGSFFVEENENRLAEMTYTLSGPEIMIIDHTEVDESLKGQGVGNQLLDHAVAYAREKNLKIIPLCPFANAVFKRKHEEYKDVLRS